MSWQASIQLKNQHPKDLIEAKEIMKKHRHDDSVTKKTQHKTPKHDNFNKQNRSGENEDKGTKEEPQASFAQKSKLI